MPAVAATDPAPAPTLPLAEPAEVDAALAACDGDPRKTIATLLADNATLNRELDFAGLALSYGFTRGWFARQRAMRQG